MRQTAAQIVRRVRRRNPFEGDIIPTRVPLSGLGRPSLPVPHPWNFRNPIAILDTYFLGAEKEPGSGRHNRYFDVPGLPLGLVTRDPQVIRAVLLATGDKPGQFDRDTSPARGIARFTGVDSMLYANGPQWRAQKKLASPPLSRSTLFQPERFHEFEATFRATVTNRIEVLRARQEESGQETVRVPLMPEVSAVMLEMLVNNVFGARVPYDELRARHVPAIEGLIERMVRDTVGFQYLAPVRRLFGADDRVKVWRRDFEALTDIALAGRQEGRGLWRDFQSDAPDDALRSNIRVFLAGALEATTSFASWALSHLSRRPTMQERIYEEVRHLDVYDPDNLGQAVTLNHALEETLRLTPSLYFLPRRATVDTWIETEDGRRMRIPKGTHVVLDVWHANRANDFWGKHVTGYRADAFCPERWQTFAEAGRAPKETPHFGFGHGPRVCPGKYLGQVEVGLVVGACLKVFRLSAVNEQTRVKAGVSTKPEDGVLVDLSLR